MTKDFKPFLCEYVTGTKSQSESESDSRNKTPFYRKLSGSTDNATHPNHQLVTTSQDSAPTSHFTTKHIKTPKETAPIMAIDLTKREQLIWILFGVIVIAVILFLMKDKIIPARLISSIKYG